MVSGYMIKNGDYIFLLATATRNYAAFATYNSTSQCYDFGTSVQSNANSVTTKSTVIGTNGYGYISGNRNYISRINMNNKSSIVNEIKVYDTSYSNAYSLNDISTIDGVNVIAVGLSGNLISYKIY